MYRLSNVYRWLHLSARMFKANHPKGALHRECRRYAKEVLASVHEPQFIGSHIYRKMIWYMVENVWLALQMHRAHGLPASAADRKRYALGAPLFAVADFLIDDTEKPLDTIRSFINNPDTELDFPHREIFRAFHHAFMATLPSEVSTEAIMQYYFSLHEAQLASRAQKAPTTSSEQIDTLVRDKIGIGFQMIRSLVPTPWLVGEEAAWYELGALTQYCNDIQDLHKDLKGGVRNFASTRPSLKIVKEDLRQQQAIATQALFKLPLPTAATQRLRFDFEAFVLVMEAKMEWYQKQCGGTYDPVTFASLPKKAVHLPPYHPFMLRRCLPTLFRWAP